MQESNAVLILRMLVKCAGYTKHISICMRTVWHQVHSSSVVLGGCPPGYMSSNGSIIEGGGFGKEDKIGWE